MVRRRDSINRRGIVALGVALAAWFAVPDRAAAQCDLLATDPCATLTTIVATPTATTILATPTATTILATPTATTLLATPTATTLLATPTLAIAEPTEAPTVAAVEPTEAAILPTVSATVALE